MFSYDTLALVTDHKADGAAPTQACDTRILRAREMKRERERERERER